MPSGSSPPTEIDPPGERGRARSAARVGNRLQPAPPRDRRAGSSRSAGGSCRGRPCDRRRRRRFPPSDVTPRCSRGVGPGDDRPAPRAEIERERVPREPSTLADAAGDDDPAAGDARTGGGTRERHARKRSPRTLLEDEGRSQRRAGHRVAAEHVRLAADADGHRVVDADREVGKAPPGVPRRRVRIDAPRRTAVDREAAQHDDLVPDDGCGDLGARKRHRRPRLPLRTVPRPRPPRRPPRRGALPRQSLMSGGIHLEREPVDPAHDDGSAGIAASRAACLPDLAVDPNLPLGPERVDGDAALADQRLDTDRGLPALRPPDERARSPRSPAPPRSRPRRAPTATGARRRRGRSR